MQKKFGVLFLISNQSEIYILRITTTVNMISSNSFYYHVFFRTLHEQITNDNWVEILYQIICEDEKKVQYFALQLVKNVASEKVISCMSRTLVGRNQVVYCLLRLGPSHKTM